MIAEVIYKGLGHPDVPYVKGPGLFPARGEQVLRPLIERDD